MAGTTTIGKVKELRPLVDSLGAEIEVRKVESILNAVELQVDDGNYHRYAVNRCARLCWQRRSCTIFLRNSTGNSKTPHVHSSHSSKTGVRVYRRHQPKRAEAPRTSGGDEADGHCRAARRDVMHLSSGLRDPSEDEAIALEVVLCRPPP